MASKRQQQRKSSIRSSPVSPCVVSRPKVITEADLNPLKKELDKLRCEISELKKEVASLKQDAARAEDVSRIQSTVNDRLKNEIDRLEQYGRRNCLVLKGIPPSRNEDTKGLEDTVKNILTEDLKLSSSHSMDFDKAHRIGPVFTDAKGKKQQNTIVRFKGHSSRYAAYAQRNNLRAKRIKIKPSLTNRRRKILDEACNKYSDHPLIDFLFCDVHGDLMVKLAQKFKKNNFHKFNDLEGLQYLLHEASLENVNNSSTYDDSDSASSSY